MNISKYFDEIGLELIDKLEDDFRYKFYFKITGSQEHFLKKEVPKILEWGEVSKEYLLKERDEVKILSPTWCICILKSKLEEKKEREVEKENDLKEVYNEEINQVQTTFNEESTTPVINLEKESEKYKKFFQPKPDEDGFFSKGIFAIGSKEKALAKEIRLNKGMRRM